MGISNSQIQPKYFVGSVYVFIQNRSETIIGSCKIKFLKVEDQGKFTHFLCFQQDDGLSKNYQISIKMKLVTFQTFQDRENFSCFQWNNNSQNYRIGCRLTSDKKQPFKRELQSRLRLTIGQDDQPNELCQQMTNPPISSLNRIPFEREKILDEYFVNKCNDIKKMIQQCEQKLPNLQEGAQFFNRKTHL